MIRLVTRARLAASFAVGSSALALTSCNHSAAAPAPPASGPPVVHTVAARVATLRRSLQLSGLIAPLHLVALSDTLAEPALAVNVEVGTVVRRGEVLATLDTADLQGRLAAASHTAASDAAKTSGAAYGADYTFRAVRGAERRAVAALAQAEQTLRNDARNLARDRELLAQGYVSARLEQQQRTTVRLDRASLVAKEAALRTARTNVAVNGGPERGLQASTIRAAREQASAALGTRAEITAQIHKAIIRSPVDGVVVNRNFNPGEYPSGRQLFTIEVIDRVYAMLNASAQDIPSVAIGARAYVEVAGHQHAGQVTAIVDQVAPGATNYTVQALFPNANLALRPGMPVAATVVEEPLRGVTIPETAFLSSEHHAVFAVQNGRAHRIAVNELGTDGTRVVVSGLTAGTRVIEDGTTIVDSGQRVAAH